MCRVSLPVCPRWCRCMQLCELAQSCVLHGLPLCLSGKSQTWGIHFAVHCTLCHSIVQLGGCRADTCGTFIEKTTKSFCP